MRWLCEWEEDGKVKEFCVREKAPVLAAGPTRETMLRLHTDRQTVVCQTGAVPEPYNYEYLPLICFPTQTGHAFNLVERPATSIR